MANILWKGPADTLVRSTLGTTPAGYRMAGTLVTSRAGVPLEIRYVVMTDPEWRARDVGVHILGGEPDARLALAGDGEGTWTLDGNVLPDLAGCLDVVLGFTPAGETLIVNRLGLEVGDWAVVRALSIGFPGDQVEAVDRAFVRLEKDSYLITADGAENELRLNADGLAVSYGVWEAVASN